MILTKIDIVGNNTNYEYCQCKGTVIFASQVSDSLALIYPLADLVGFSKPSQ